MGVRSFSGPGRNGARHGAAARAAWSLVVVVVLFALTAGGARAAPAAPYTAVDLGTLGGLHSHANAISDSGQVVGWSYVPESCCSYHAFSWTPGDGMVDVGTLGGGTSEAMAVNDNGQVVGSSEITPMGDSHAFLWTREGGIVDLGTLGGSSSGARAINDHGQVIGGSTTADGAFRAFSWTATGGMVDLGTLGGSIGAVALNESGQVVGYSVTPDVQFRAFSWTQAGGLVNLGTLGGSFSYAYAVTDDGQVYGVSTTADGVEHAFRWTAQGGMVDLGALGFTYGMTIVDVADSGHFVGSTLVSGGHAFSWTQADGLLDLGTLGGLNSYASAVNDDGDVVGWSETGPFESHAFVWNRAVGMIDLGTFGGTASQATAVNAGGQIVGRSSTGGTWPATHAVLWIPAVVDTTPPALTLPADLTGVDATGPGGAVVAFAATATDENPPSPVVTCTPPSGSLFAIGVTTVDCRATDAAGNTATGSFDITVEGAPEQLDELQAAVDDVGPGTSLADKVGLARAAYDAGDTRLACEILAAFASQVEAQSGKSIPADEAPGLIADATRIRAVLGC